MLHSNDNHQQQQPQHKDRRKHKDHRRVLRRYSKKEQAKDVKRQPSLRERALARQGKKLPR